MVILFNFFPHFCLKYVYRLHYTTYGTLILASTTLKYASLLTLTVQNTLLIVSMRYSRLVPPEQRYITTTAVVFSEFAKMCVCLLIIFFREKTFKEFVKTLHHHLIEEWKDTLKMSVPAIVYMIQNNLQYVAVSNLEAAVFQVPL